MFVCLENHEKRLEDTINMRTYDAVIEAGYRLEKYKDVVRIFNVMRKQFLFELHLNSNTCEKIVLAHETIGDCENALKLLRKFPCTLELGRNQRNNGMVSTQRILLAAESGMSSLAIDLFEEMKTLNLVPTSSTYYAVIYACWKSQKPEQALSYYEEMRAVKLTSSSLVTSTAIKALWDSDRFVDANNIFEQFISKQEDSREHRLTLNLLQDLKSYRLTPNTLLYSAIISSSNKNGKYGRDLALLKSMQKRGFDPEVSALSAALAVYSKEKQTRKARNLFAAAIRSGTLKGEMFHSNTLDLHGYPVALSKYMVRYFTKLQKKSRRTVYIITGKGRHRNKNGARGILRKEVASFIEDELKLRFSPVHNNNGCLMVFL